MTLMLILVALALLASAATLRDVFGDRGRRQPPTSQFEDPMFRAPSARI